jgi:hypothetical protein
MVINGKIMARKEKRVSRKRVSIINQTNLMPSSVHCGEGQRGWAVVV